MNEWVELKGCRPKQGQTVLVCGPLVGVQSAQFWEHEPGLHEGDTGFIDSTDCEIFPVTHWMPMPEPPQ
jgi:hypothetical protein